MALNFLILHLVPLARVVQGNALGNCSDPSIHAWGVFPVFLSSRSLLTSYSSQLGPSLGIVLHTLNLTQGYDQLLQYNLEHSWRAIADPCSRGDELCNHCSTSHSFFFLFISLMPLQVLPFLPTSIYLRVFFTREPSLGRILTRMS